MGLFTWILNCPVHSASVLVKHFINGRDANCVNGFGMAIKKGDKSLK
jgi:hypothetical protein